MTKKVMLIDGNSLTYRAFFALPTDLATASGQVTNAVFGFTSMLVNLLRDHQPDRIVVAFDRPEPTFRHKQVDTYKAGRKETPDILIQQFPLVRQVLDVLNIPSIEQIGIEADDILATLATRARDQGDDVIVVSGDRDVYQLVEDPHIKVLYNLRGVSEYAFYDEAAIFEKCGVTPKDYVKFAALRGDKSDNLPGVMGVGEKTAAKLITRYGDMDGIYAHVDDQTPKLRENLIAGEPNARLNIDMMELVRDADIDVDLDALVMGDMDPDEVKQLFDFLEFQTLHARLGEALGQDVGAGPAAETIEAETTVCESPADVAATMNRLATDSAPLVVAAAWNDDAQRSLGGLALVVDRDSGDVVWIDESQLANSDVRRSLAQLVGDNGRPIIGHGLKPLVRALLSDNEQPIEITHLQLDTLLAAYLLDPAEARYLLDDLLFRYANRSMPEQTEAAAGQLSFGDDSTPTSQIVAREAIATAFIAEPIADALEAQGLTALNVDMELPLVGVLARMENLGVGVDVGELTALRDDLASRASTLAAAIIADAGHEFNVNSPKQLQVVLFEELGLTPQKKTKTGFSTNAQVLEKMVGEHPIIEHLLEYREVEKLRSTYGVGLLAEVGEGDRIRATFNQTVARTGRLSSDAPNLHNIPVRSETGRGFRKAFVAADGYELLVADYNQIELRCIAHLALDPGLIDAFESGVDIHNATASRIFGVAADEVTSAQRSKAKMVSYGLAYGMEAYGLSQRLNVPVGEAQEILDAYFDAFPAVKQYMDDTVEEARRKGYTETLFGRRRQIPELASSNFRIRQAGERQAMNSGIQGLAADIFKVALVNLDAALRDRNAQSRLILQVHDEVILEVTPDERDDMAALVTQVMADAFDLRVPLLINLSFGHTWADAK